MLDTNTANYAIKGYPTEVRQQLAMLPMKCIVISTVTQAELLYGLARKGRPAALTKVIQEFLLRVQVLPWDEAAATVYGDLRTNCTVAGITLGAHDMLIAAHAVAAGTRLVTHDKAFSLIPSNALIVEDWIKGV